MTIIQIAIGSAKKICPLRAASNISMAPSPSKTCGRCDSWGRYPKARTKRLW